MKLFELQIIRNMEELGRRYPSLNPTNHYVEYDVMVNSIHSNIGIMLGTLMVQVLEQKCPENHWMSWEDIIHCVSSWPLELRSDDQYPILTDYMLYSIASTYFFAFHEWKKSWITCN